MKTNLNELPKVGETIMCLHMDGETSVPPGTLGNVKKIVRDPFEKDGYLIEMTWENGSSLSLVSATDAWRKISEKGLNEQRGDQSVWNFITQNEDIFENFDWRWLEKFLYKIRESGIINMFGASPLLYAGREHIDRYYGEGREDDENFQEVLDLADEAKNKIIQGVVNFMEKNNKNLEDMNLVNRYAQNFANKIVGLYIAFSGFRSMN